MIERNHRTDRQRGFTLAEILVTTAIFAIIMIAALTVYDKSNQVFKQSTEAADLQQSTRIAFDKLVADLRMAGFDYNRGGPPIGENQYQQPDEQIEFAGPTALAFRANLNYNTASGDCITGKTDPCGNGLEPAYTPKTDKGAPIFPWVTTGNDEVIVYALRSADTSKNTDTVSFYMDDKQPRAAYPDAAAKSPTNGREEKVVVSGIDMSNANPPYTLYRMTLSDVLNSRQGTPVAENIRSLHFIYYSDLKGATVLADPPLAGTIVPVPIEKGRNAGGVTFDATYLDANGTKQYTGAVGGDGLYDANDVGTAANFVDRSTRAFIQSVRVDLVGMNSQPDSKFVEQTETIGTIKNYRQYHLSALVAPRNLGLTGFPEPAYHAPEPPSITGICTAHCAAPVLCWKPAASDSPILQYEIAWDTNPLGSFNAYKFIVTDPTATTAVIPDTYGIDPSVTWYYRIKAVNDNGASEPSNPVSAQPKNSTKPLPPTGAAVTGAQYSLAVGWTAPTNNTPSSTATCSSGGCSTDPTIIPSVESMRYNVYRSTSATFDSSKAVKILSYSTAQTAVGPGAKGSFIDSPTSSAYPPGTCVDYYYFLQAVDRCYNSGNGAWNSGGNANNSVSDLKDGDTSKAFARASDVPTATANAPISISINTPTSACPNAAGTFCDIDLRWSKVTADSAGNAIGVDRYKISRFHKKEDDLTYSPDSSFDVSGFSSISGGTNSYKDQTAPAFTNLGEKWYYQYTVAADDCHLGAASAPVTYPTPCATSPTILQSGATNGLTATGTTPNDPWIFNGGDTITVTAAAGGTIDRADFTTLTYPAGGQVGTTKSVAKPNPFIFSWVDTGVSGQIYAVKIVVTYSGGCTETHVRYVQEYMPAACAFANQTPVFSSANIVKGATATVNQNFTITNSGQDSMRLQQAVVGGTTFTHNITITWVDPNRSGSTNPHDDLTLTEIDYSLPSGAVIKDVITSPPSIGSSAATLTTSRPIPNTVGDLATTTSLSIKILWTYKKTEADLVATPVSKICLGYHLFVGLVVDANDTAQKNCNLVGQSASTANPNSCD